MLKTFLILIFVSIVSFADFLKIGDTLTPFNLPDQFDKVHTISSDKYEIFLVSFAKETSGKVNEFLKTTRRGIFR